MMPTYYSIKIPLKYDGYNLLFLADPIKYKHINYYFYSFFLAKILIPTFTSLKTKQNLPFSSINSIARTTTSRSQKSLPSQHATTTELIQYDYFSIIIYLFMVQSAFCPLRISLTTPLCTSAWAAVRIRTVLLTLRRCTLERRPCWLEMMRS